MTPFVLIIAALLPAQALAQTYHCAGSDPDWQLEIESDHDKARFHFPAVTEMDVMLTTQAEGLDWPRAFTLVGDRDTAIALLELESCQDQPYRAHVMTQRGQTPILLGGCCQDIE